MKKLEFLKIVDELNLDKQSYCIISGGVMLMYDLKEETEDVDLKVKPELFKELSTKYKFTKSQKYSYLYELFNNIEISVLDFNSNDIVWINGYPVESIKKQLEWKLANNRDKDIDDIRIIKEYLNREYKKYNVRKRNRKT